MQKMLANLVKKIPLICMPDIFFWFNYWYSKTKKTNSLTSAIR